MFYSVYFNFNDLSWISDSLALDLQAPIPPVRKKARYVSFLQGLVESCNRSTM